jgi:hypothetical protein
MRASLGLMQGTKYAHISVVGFSLVKSVSGRGNEIRPTENSTRQPFHAMVFTPFQTWEAAPFPAAPTARFP